VAAMRAADLAPAYQSAAGQGVCADGHPHSRGARGRTRVGQPHGCRSGWRSHRLREKDHGAPQQAVESTKRVLNIHLERAVLASLDYALSAESQSFLTEDFRANVAKFNASKN